MSKFRAIIPAVPTILVDDRHSRVTRWDFEPGAETGFHRHGMAYVVVPMTDMNVRIEDSGGTREVFAAAGAAYSREAGVEHNVANAGSAAMAFIEIEMKNTD